MLRVPHRAVVALAVFAAACGRSETPTFSSAPSQTKADAAPRRTSPAPETPAPAPLDALLADLRSDDAAVRAKAGAAVLASGAAGVDALFEWLAIADESDDRPSKAVHLLPQFGQAAVPGAVRLLGHASADVRLRAIDVLHEVRGFWVRADDGPDVAKALFGLWDDPDDTVRRCVRDTLPTERPAAGCIAAALKARLDPKDEATLPTLVSLSLLGDAASPAAPRIAEFLSSDDENLRTCAAETLRMLGPNAATALPQIAVVLETGTTAQRVLAFDAIEGMGEATSSIAPTLMKLLDDEELGGVAAERLGACGAAGPEVVAALARVLDRRDDDNRGDIALESLCSIAEDCPARRDDVARLLLTGRTESRTALLRQLGSRPAWTGEAVACLRDPDTELRRATMQALAASKSPESSVIVACKAATSDADPIVRLQAMRAVHAWVADAPKPSIDAIAPLLTADDAYVRYQAVVTLSVLAPDVGRLRAALHDVDESVRCAAVDALGAMGAAASDAVADLVSALADPTTRRGAARNLGKIGVANDAVVGGLAKALTDADAQSDVLAVLRKFGPAAAAAAPAVRAIETENRSELADDVAQTLVAINPDRAAAVEAVLATTTSPQEKIAALAAIGVDGAAGVLRAAIGDTWSGPWMARKALKELGDAAAPAILAATRSPDAALRTVAVGCLDLVDRTAALRALDAACADVSARVRGDAAETAERLADAGVDIAPLAGRLTAMLSDDDVRARTCAARAVGRLGAAGADAVPRLRALLADGPPSTRAAAGASIHRLTGDVDGLLPMFASILRAPYGPETDGAWADVAECVASIGPRTASLADAMGSALLRSHSLTASVRLLDALATFGPAAAPALPGVRAALAAELPCGEGDDGWIAVVHAVPVVTAMGPAAAPALRELRAQKGSPEFEAAVADAIRKITAPR